MRLKSYPKARADTRRWVNDKKYGGRLRNQLGTDRWLSKVPDPVRPGRDVAKSFRARNTTEARREHESRLVQSSTGELPDNSKVTLDDLAERRWAMLEGLVASGERSSTTLEADRILYAKHLLPSLGRLRIEKMQSGHVSRLLANLRRAGYAPGTISRIYSVLRSTLNQERHGRRVLEGISKTERPSSEPIPQSAARCLTDEQVSRLLDESLPSTKILNAVYAFTGVRQSEGLAITWGDLDLPGGVLKVQAQLSRSKTDKPSRRVPLKAARRRLGAREREIDLHPDLVTMLKRHKAEQFGKGLAGASDYVTCTATGLPLGQRNALRDLGTAADRAKLNDGDEPRVSTHDLRHTAISRWIAAGLDEATVARMAGDTVEQIHKTYLHEFERSRRADEIRAKLVAGTSIRIA